MNEVATIELREAEDFWVSPCRDPEMDVGVTIVIPNYDSRATLERSLQSALSQTMREIEVVVVDDASTDTSWPYIAQFVAQDPRVRGIRNKRNLGKPAIMNRALDIARGRWLAVLDADDWYAPDRLAALIALAENRSADLVADNQYLFDSAAAEIVGPAWPVAESSWAMTIDDFLSASDAYESFNLGMLKPVIRTDFARTKSLAYKEEARQGEDFFYLLQFYLSGGRAVVADKPYYYYTQPFGTLSRRWANVGRQRYDYRTAYDINRRCVEAWSSAVTPAQAAQLRRRGSRLKSLEQYHQVKECLAHRNLIGAVGRVARMPRTLECAWWRFCKRLSGSSPSTAIERVACRARRRNT